MAKSLIIDDRSRNRQYDNAARPPSTPVKQKQADPAALIETNQMHIPATSALPNDPERRLSRVSGYLVALLAPTLIAALMQATWPFLKSNPVQPYLLAVILCAWYGGLGPGLVSLLVSFLCADFFFIEPYFAFWFPTNEEVGRLLLFLLGGVFITVVSELARREMRRATREVTKQRQATSALKENEKYLRNILDNLTGFVGLFTPEGIVLDLNQVALERTKQLREDVIGREFAETYAWNYAPEVQAEIRDTFRRVAKGEIVSRDFRPRIAKDSVIDTFAVFVPLRDADGTVVKVIGSGFDITDRKRAEAALKVSESRHRTLFEYAPDGILIADTAGFYLDANPSMCQMLGYSRDQLIGLHSSDIVTQREAGQIKPALETLKSQSDHQREWQFRRADASTFGAEVLATLMPDGNVMAVVRDLTERKRAEATVRTSEEQLRLAVAATDLGTWDFNPVSGERHGSDQSRKIFNLPLGEDLSREQIIERVHPEDRKPIDDAISQALRPESTGELHVEFRIIRKDGGLRWVESHGRASFENSVATRLIGTVLDITARKLAEDARQASELGYRRLFESAHDGILILNAESGQITDVNPYLVEMLGYAREEFIGKELWQIGVFKDIAASKLAFDELQQQGYIRYDNLPLESRAGVVRPVEVVSNSYLVGERWVIQCNIRDITERKRAEQDLSDANQEAQQALDELKTRTHELASMTQQLWQASKLATMGELAASIAHELNNPLTTVTLSVEALMLQLPENENHVAILKTVRDECERMAVLVSNLLQFSRRSHPQISILNIADELGSSINLIDYHLRSHNVKVVREIAAHLPAVRGDRQQLLQVFLNLLTNASDAMPDGGTLTVRIRPDFLGGEPGVLIEFTDTGIGIEPDGLPRIWDPFVTTKPEGKGTGLGLPICRRTIEEHGGTIEIESRPGKGTTLRILLPAMENVLSR